MKPAVVLARVLTQPDRPAGRGRDLATGPIKQAALDLGAPIEQPTALDDERLLQDWGTPPDLLVVVAYGLVLPRWLLEWPRVGCINVHASLLPRWRGAAPIQYAILSGDGSTGISIMKMVEALDAGPVYRRRSIEIGARETAGELHDRLAALGAELLLETVPLILAGQLKAEPQEAERATYAPKLSKSAAGIDWGRPALELDRMVRAFNPWPVAETTASDGRRLRIWRARPATTSTDAPPGTVLAAGKAGIDVATGAGVLRILKLQPPSGGVMSAQAYLNAHSLEGVIFGGE